MTDRKPSPQKKALDYAENVLHVHREHERAKLQLESLDELLVELDKAQDRKREINENITDREVELIGEKRGLHSDMSSTEFKTRLREWEREDGKLTALRIELNSVLSEVQGIEYDVDITRLRIKTACARMEQLGGYLNYLAAIRNQAEKITKPTESSEA
jgi:hypothetical protein